MWNAFGKGDGGISTRRISFSRNLDRDDSGLYGRDIGLPDSSQRNLPSFKVVSHDVLAAGHYRRPFCPVRPSRHLFRRADADLHPLQIDVCESGETKLRRPQPSVRTKGNRGLRCSVPPRIIECESSRQEDVQFFCEIGYASMDKGRLKFLTPDRDPKALSKDRE